MSRLREDQVINHFGRCGAVTTKVTRARSLCTRCAAHRVVWFLDRPDAEFASVSVASASVFRNVLSRVSRAQGENGRNDGLDWYENQQPTLLRLRIVNPGGTTESHTPSRFSREKRWRRIVYLRGVSSDLEETGAVAVAEKDVPLSLPHDVAGGASLSTACAKTAVHVFRESGTSARPALRVGSRSVVRGGFVLSGRSGDGGGGGCVCM